VIWRLPRNESVIYPNSYCPSCKRKILWKDKIPLLSWIYLRGKCRNCLQKISFIYPSLELFTGLAFVFSSFGNVQIYEMLQHNYSIFLSWFLLTISIPLFTIDLKYYWLPKSIILLGTFAGLIFTGSYSIFFENYLFFRHIIAGILGFSIFYLINIFGKITLKKNGIGFGDMKLMFMFGIWLGIKGLLISIYLSFLFSGLICLILIFFKKLKKGQIIPFGPFLITSSLSIWFLGDQFFLEIYDKLIKSLLFI